MRSLPKQPITVRISPEMKANILAVAMKFVLHIGTPKLEVYMDLSDSGATDDELYAAITAGWRAQHLHEYHFNIDIIGRREMSVRINLPDGSNVTLDRAALIKAARPMLNIYEPRATREIAEGLFE